jgi:hypothetical protein
MLKAHHLLLCCLWIALGTALLLKGYLYESGTTCFWLLIATLTWPWLQTYTNNRAWQLIGWFHLVLVPVFMGAHVIGSYFHFWLYEAKYLIVIPASVPLIGSIPLFEFVFYSIFMTAVLGLYAFLYLNGEHGREESPAHLRIVRIAIIAVWCITVAMILFKPNPYRTQFPYWFSLMFCSWIPFGCAALGIQPFDRFMPFVRQVCSTRAFVLFCLLFLPLLDFWELSAIAAGLWVYNPAMNIAHVARLTPEGMRFWPVVLFYGHINCAIFVFLMAYYRKKRTCAN